VRLCLLNATPCSILASSLRMSDAGVVRLLVFRVGNLVCAAEAERVREILPRLATTRIPGTPPLVAGLVNVRGTLVTVVEGWRALRQPEPPAANGPQSGTTVLLEAGGGEIPAAQARPRHDGHRDARHGRDRRRARDRQAGSGREDPDVQRHGPAGVGRRGDPSGCEGLRREAVPAIARARSRPARPG